VSDKNSYPITESGIGGLLEEDKGTVKFQTSESPSKSKGSGLYCHILLVGR